MATFRLHINLGNAAMLTAEEVACALERTATDVRQYSNAVEISVQTEAVRPTVAIRDENGNHVGEWTITRP